MQTVSNAMVRWDRIVEVWKKYPKVKPLGPRPAWTYRGARRNQAKAVRISSDQKRREAELIARRAAEEIEIRKIAERKAKKAEQNRAYRARRKAAMS